MDDIDGDSDNKDDDGFLNFHQFTFYTLFKFPTLKILNSLKIYMVSHFLLTQDVVH